METQIVPVQSLCLHRFGPVPSARPSWEETPTATTDGD